MPAIVPASKLGRTVTVETSHRSLSAGCIHLKSEDLLRYVFGYPVFQRATTDSVHHYFLDDVIIEGSFQRMWRGSKFVEEFFYGVNRTQLPKTDRTILVDDRDPTPVIIGFNWTCTNYFHWLFQAVASIYSIVSRHGHSGVRLALPQLSRLQEETLERLGLAHLPRVLIRPEKQYRFRKVAFASILTARSSLYDQFGAYANALAFARPPARSAHNLLYVSRQDAEIRRVENEEAIVEMVQRKGFSIVEAGKHSLDEQISIFRNADVVVGPHGAGLTNTMFCPPGTIVYEFMTRQYLNPSYANLAQNLGHEYFVEIFYRPGSSQTNHWIADLDRIERGVDSVLARLASS
jgi:capsular polysaccharide biosynthesis protein